LYSLCSPVTYHRLSIIYSSYVKEYYGRGHGIVSNLKLVEIVVMGATALLAAVKYVLKFLDYAGKLSVGYATRAI